MTLFSDMLMEHFQSPANRGEMTGASIIGKGSLDGNPPFVTFYLRIDRNHVVDATFQAEGCGVTIACGSMLTELVHGRSLAECRQIAVHDLAQALDGIPGENTAYRHLRVARCPRELAEVLEKRS